MQIILNGETKEVGRRATIADLLKETSVERGFAVEVNDELVPRSEHQTRELHPGDRIEIVTLVGGG